MTRHRIAICLSTTATPLEHYAAEELQRYLEKLFHVSAQITTGESALAYKFVVGLRDDPFVQAMAGELPELSEQGHIVRRVGRRTMVLAGGSPAAVCWAVYELIEQYGVRFLLHGDDVDVFGDEVRFYMPQLDEVFVEPVQKVRGFPMFVDLPTGSALWSREENLAFIRQVFKLKFNTIVLHSYPQAPVVDYCVQGISRNSACLLFGQKIPVDADNTGCETIAPTPCMTHCDLIGMEDDFPKLLEAGQRIIREMMDEAKRLGMYVVMPIGPMEFPLEFAPLLEKPSGEVQLGGQTVAELGDLTNPNHVELVRAQIEAYLDTYPDMDELILELPENPQAASLFEQSWTELCSRHNLAAEYDMEAALASVMSNHIPAGGVARSERDFKSAISMLNFFDKFFAANNLLDKANGLGVRLSFGIGVNAVEAYPLLGKVAWEGASFSTCVDYTSSRAVRSMDSLEDIDAVKLSPLFGPRLQDDNPGWLPQVSTENLHILLQKTASLGWRGFILHYWPIGDLDPMFAYIARASWSVSPATGTADLTPHDAYEDHFRSLYDSSAVEPMCQVMRMLEDATVLLDVDLGCLFPVLGIAGHYIKSDKPMSNVLYHVRGIYEQALIMLDGLRGTYMSPAGRTEMQYRIARLEFSIAALTELGLLCDGGVAVSKAKAALELGDTDASSKCVAEAKAHYDEAIAYGERAIRAMAEVARDGSDRGAIAAYYHFLVREARQLCDEHLASVGKLAV